MNRTLVLRAAARVQQRYRRMFPTAPEHLSSLNEIIGQWSLKHKLPIIIRFGQMQQSVR